MTIAPRWRKVLGDIAEAPFRTALAVLAMAAGVFGIGMILTSYSILTRELARTYSETRPSSAILVLDGVTGAVVESVRRIPGVADAEARPVIGGRVRVGQDEWAPLILFVVQDFNDLRIDKLRRDAGAWPPADDEVLLERTALSVARAAIGDSVTVRTAGDEERTLRVAGSVHAAGLAPAWMDHAVSGFVGWRSISRTGAQAEAAGLRILVDGDRLDEAHIREVADRVKEWIEKQGQKVLRVEVPEPGRHPHADQMDTFLYLLGAFGALTLVLSAVLVANMIHALLTEQVRQVGVMKAIGASTGQVVSLYLGQVSILAAVSLCLGMPLGLSAGRGYARFATGILNADIAGTAVPFWVMAVQIAAGIAVPLLVALTPVYQASRITIHEAFSGDVGRRPFGTRRFDRWLARIRHLPRPLMLSLRTTFHRRGRLGLTVSTLAAGGAVFISALNVSGAWTRALDEYQRSHPYDIEVRFSRPSPVARAAGAVAALPDVEHAEYWAETSAFLVEANGAANRRVSVIGPDNGTKLLDLPILEGRWLTPEDVSAVVINQALQARAPKLRVGDKIELRVGGRSVSWPIVGVAKEIIPVPTAYAPSRSVLDAMGPSSDGLTRGIRVVTRRHDAAAQRSAQQGLERTLQRQGVGVLEISQLLDRRKAIEDHLVIVESALLLASGLVVLVGGLGLTSTLTINVVVRTREIGILSAIGATPRTISRHVMFEGVLMGLLSWGMAILLAVPVTLWLEVVAGRIFHKTSLGFFMSPRAATAWLALVVILASLSSFYPARRAARLTPREALAYE